MTGHPEGLGASFPEGLGARRDVYWGCPNHRQGQFKGQGELPRSQTRQPKERNGQPEECNGYITHGAQLIPVHHYREHMYILLRHTTHVRARTSLTRGQSRGT